MKINFKKFSTVLLSTVLASVIFISGCKKNTDPEIEQPDKKFTEYNENEQKAILIKEFNGRGGDYTLSQIATFDEKGDVVQSYTAFSCERLITISVPNEIDKNLEMKQTASEGACGVNYGGIYHNAIRLTFANYKVGVSFFTVQKDQPQLDYVAMMFYDPAKNTDPKYLVLSSFRADDLQRMNNDEKDVVGRPYKEYVFARK